MWYSTYEAAQEACRHKEKEYGESFIVITEDTGKELIGGRIYWAQRRSAIKNFPENLST